MADERQILEQVIKNLVAVRQNAKRTVEQVRAEQEEEDNSEFKPRPLPLFIQSNIPEQ